MAPVARRRQVLGLVAGCGLVRSGWGLRVDGAKLVESDGRAVSLVGVTYGGPLECMSGEGGPQPPPPQQQPAKERGSRFASNPLEAMASVRNWGHNAVRIELEERCWLGLEGRGHVRYRSRATEVIEAALTAGVYPIVGLTGTHAEMPSAEYSVEAWISVATVLGERDRVLFELFGDPKPSGGRADDDAWHCWAQGECSDLEYRAAGMSDVVKAVRDTGARNVLLLAGVAGASDLTRWLEFAPADDNIAAAIRAQPYTQDWQHSLSSVLQSVPVVVTDAGDSPDIWRWLDSHNTSLLGAKAWTGVGVDDVASDFLADAVGREWYEWIQHRDQRDSGFQSHVSDGQSQAPPADAADADAADAAAEAATEAAATEAAAFLDEVVVEEEEHPDQGLSTPPFEEEQQEEVLSAPPFEEEAAAGWADDPLPADDAPSLYEAPGVEPPPPPPLEEPIVPEDPILDLPEFEFPRTDDVVFQAELGARSEDPPPEDYLQADALPVQQQASVALPTFYDSRLRRNILTSAKIALASVLITGLVIRWRRAKRILDKPHRPNIKVSTLSLLRAESEAGDVDKSDQRQLPLNSWLELEEDACGLLLEEKEN